MVDPLRTVASSIALVLLLAVPAAIAAEPDAPAEEVDQNVTPTAPQPGKQKVFTGAITVTDKPILEGNEVDRSGSIVAKVSERQIDDLYAQDLSAALRRVPGVVISRYNVIGAFGGGDGGAIFIRGHGSARPGAEIVTMTDGVPRFVGIWTHPLLDPLSVDAVDSIAVYRSAQPVLLGNMSFGAVDMTSKRRSGAGNGGRFVGSYGTHDTVIGEFEYGGRSERLDYFVTASHKQSDGHRDTADGQVQALSGRIGYRFSDEWDFSFLLQHTEGDVNDPGVDGLPPSPVVENYGTTGDFALADLSHGHGAWQGHVKLYLDRLDADWRQWNGEEFTTVTESRNYGIRIRETVSPWQGGELVLGVDHDVYGGRTWDRRDEADGRVTDLSFRNTAPYLMLSHVFGGAVTVTPSVGVRYNDSRYFGGEWGGQAGVKIGLGAHAFYANYAHAFNLPGVYAAVLYGGWGRGDQWQDLEAETVDHVEVGWLAALSESVRLDISVYRDEVENALRIVPPPPPPPQFANIGAYDVQGIEVSLRADVTSRLGVFVGGTYNDPDPVDVPNLPRSTVVGGLGWTSARAFRINADVEWVDERYILNPRSAPGQAKVDGYLLVNGRAGIPLRWLGMGVDGEVFVAGQNLADEDYEFRIGYPMPGRTINIGIDMSF